MCCVPGSVLHIFIFRSTVTQTAATGRQKDVRNIKNRSDRCGDAYPCWPSMCQRWSWSVRINIMYWRGGPCLLRREVCAAVSWHTGTQTAVTHMASDHPDLIYTLQPEQKPLKEKVRCWAVNYAAGINDATMPPSIRHLLDGSGVVTPTCITPWCQWPKRVVGCVVRVEACWHGCVLSTV